MWNWGLVFVGNFVGVLIVVVMMVFVFIMGFNIDGGVIVVKVVSIGEVCILGYVKYGFEGWMIIFICGMLCNWMVFMGVVGVMVLIYVSGKVIVMWMFIMLFFFMVFEYLVVNMFLFLFSLIMGGDFFVVDYLIWNEILIVFGNLVGGLVFIGFILYIMYYCIKLKCKLVIIVVFIGDNVIVK